MKTKIVEENQAIAHFYYGAQQFFRSIGLMLETAANTVQDMGYEVISWGSGKAFQMVSYTHTTHRGACLPRYYTVVFKPKEDQQAKVTTYALFVYFFSDDPNALIEWVPCGSICKSVLKEKGQWDYWSAAEIISKHIRPFLITPHPELAYSLLSPSEQLGLSGQGFDQLRSLEVVPFALSAIKHSDDLNALVSKVVRSLVNGTARELKTDREYLRRFLGVEESG